MMNLFNSPRRYVIKTTMKVLGIDKKQATQRVNALGISGILEQGSPDDFLTRMLIENFLRFDLSKKLDYLEVFHESMNFPELIRAYDESSGQHLTRILAHLKSIDDPAPSDTKKQIQLFDNFFCHKIWNRFPGVEKFGDEANKRLTDK